MTRAGEGGPEERQQALRGGHRHVWCNLYTHMLMGMGSVLELGLLQGTVCSPEDGGLEYSMMPVLQRATSHPGTAGAESDLDPLSATLGSRIIPKTGWERKLPFPACPTSHHIQKGSPDSYYILPSGKT